MSGERPHSGFHLIFNWWNTDIDRIYSGSSFTGILGTAAMMVPFAGGFSALIIAFGIIGLIFGVIVTFTSSRVILSFREEISDSTLMPQILSYLNL